MNYLPPIGEPMGLVVVVSVNKLRNIIIISQHKIYSAVLGAVPYCSFCLSVKAFHLAASNLAISVNLASGLAAFTSSLCF